MFSLLGSNLPAERVAMYALVLNGVPYLPHYRNVDIYVGPGYGKHNFDRYTAQQLLLKGAQYQPEMLWERGVDGVVNEVTP
jgi:hypothetical protein